MDTAPLPSNVDAELLDRYVAGELSAGEAEYVTGLLDQHAALATIVDRMRRLSPSVENFPDPADTEAALAVTLRRARIGAPSRGSIRASRLGWAGAGMIGALLAIVVLQRTQSSRISTSSSSQTYTTNSGQQARITLPDGSIVRLAPQSRLDILGRFGAEARTLALRGEAYFEVARATGAPFVVRTGTVTTRVLGTAFDIRKYDEDVRVHVAVVSGKVSASGRMGTVVVTPGRVAHLSDSSVTTDTMKRTSAFTAWTTGQLVFDDTPVSAALTTVGRWYGYRFEFVDSALGRQHVTATFSAKSFAETIAELEDLLDVKMTVDGTRITLHPQRTGKIRRAPMLHRAPSMFTTPREVGK